MKRTDVIRAKIRDQNTCFVVKSGYDECDVPGVMVSMWGSSALTDIILNKKTVEISLVLNRLSKAIGPVLLQNKNHAREDGMDIGICIVNKQISTLEFARGYYCLYYFRAGEIYIAKENRMSARGFQFNKVFEKNHQTECFFICVQMAARISLGNQT